MAGGGKVEVTLGSDASTGDFPAGAAKVEESKDLDQQLDPPGSAGCSWHSTCGGNCWLAGRRSSAKSITTALPRITALRGWPTC